LVQSKMVKLLLKNPAAVVRAPPPAAGPIAVTTSTGHGRVSQEAAEQRRSTMGDKNAVPGPATFVDNDTIDARHWSVAPSSGTWRYNPERGGRCATMAPIVTRSWRRPAVR
jgi:hypothetical protein